MSEDSHALTASVHQTSQLVDPRRHDTSRLTEALLQSWPTGQARDIDVSELAAAVADARQSYQHSHYQRALRLLPQLVADVGHVLHIGTRSPQSALCALTGSVHQTASGLLLKFNAPTLAAVAADRSMAAAAASDNLVTLAASSRAVVHALTAGGHPDAAVRCLRQVGCR